jgi:hypothetical protein
MLAELKAQDSLREIEECAPSDYLGNVLWRELHCSNDALRELDKTG